jgi:hypothetical protein
MIGKMRAFVSYSVDREEEYIVSLLSFRLRAKNFIPNTSIDFFKEVLDEGTKCDILSSHLFVGILLGDAAEASRVVKEWKYALQHRVPNLLLVEDTISLPKSFKGNIIRFNRAQPQVAIDEITSRMLLKGKPEKASAEPYIPWIWAGNAMLAILAAVGMPR